MVLETVLHTLLHIAFRLQPIGGHGLNKLAAHINFRFRKKKRKNEDREGLQILPPCHVVGA
jgi:hypothetical protein